MSPRHLGRPSFWLRFPRVSGDEPGGEGDARGPLKFSPRERG